MGQPTLCMIFDVIGGQSAIGKVAANDVRIALEAGYKVTAVARDLAQDLKSNVEWLRLHVPKRLFAYQWLSGRRLIRKALGTRRFDIIHAHQPQIADVSDIFQCHYLTRMAYLKQCLEFRRGFKPRILRVQQQIVLYAEDLYYRRWRPESLMLYGSHRTRDDFHRIYGQLPREEVLLLNADPIQIPSPEQKRQARLKLIGHDFPGTVVGFLGGVQKRKGYDRIVEAVSREPNLFLLMGGPYSEGATETRLSGRFASMGDVKDTNTFYAACDVFAVPSRYEPLGLVAFEAAARGLPVFATGEVGALPHLLKHQAGVVWAPQERLGPLVHDLCARRAHFNAGAASLSAELSLANYSCTLLSHYRTTLTYKDQSLSRPRTSPFKASSNRSLVSTTSE